MRRAVRVDDDSLERLRIVHHDLQLGDQLGEEPVDGLEIGDGVRDLGVEAVDAVESVEQRSECPAQRNVETVWLPIEIVLEGPDEVVEIRDVIVYLIGDLLQILHGEHRRVQVV
jgi:hypothetical protein